MEKEVKLSVIETEKKYSVPDYSESTYGVNSIVSYGRDNDMPILLRNCYRGSATLKSIIDGYIPYILGEDIIINDKIAKFDKQVNSKGMSMRQFIASISLDYMIYGGFAFQIIYNKMGGTHELIPLDFARVRTNESGTKIFYAKKNWSKYGTKSQEYEPYIPGKLQKTCIYYYKGDFTKNVYPLPTWYGALTDVLTEMEASRYSLNSVSNGFAARYLINLPNSGNLTKEQKEVIEKGIKDKLCGVETDSNFMLYYATGDKAVTVSKLESDDTAEKYIAIKDNCRSNIYTSLRATPLLFGLPNASNGFSTSEYSDSFKLFQKTVIKPIQDIIVEALDKVFEKSLGGEQAIEIIPFKIVFEDV